MKQKPMFEPGDEVIVTTDFARGQSKEEPGKVKEMAGALNVAVLLGSGDRIVNVKRVRLVNPLQQKAVAPKNFEPSTVGDIRAIGVLVRGARNSRNISNELMAVMLRTDVPELTKIETGAQLPSEDLILRLADIFCLPLDPLIASLEYSRAQFAKKESERLELEREARAATEAARLKAEAEQKASEERQRLADAAARSFELFCEQLMDLVPVPLEHQARKQWYGNARGLFQLKP